MYFYKLIETEYHEGQSEGSYSSEIMYIYHENKFDNQEFVVMCKSALMELSKEDQPFMNTLVAEKLSIMFGFKLIEMTASYEFEVW